MFGIPALTLIQFAISVMKLVNWFTAQITQKQWEDSGYAKAMAEQVAILQKNSAIAEKAFNEAKKATDADLDKELKS
jgi:hypothetical protein